MSPNIEQLLGKGIDSIRYLAIVKESLRDTSFARQLCDKVETFFTPFFNELINTPEKWKANVDSFAGFEHSLQKAVDLLREIQEFLAPFVASNAQFSVEFAQTLLANDSLRNQKILEISTFNQRLHKCVAELLPEVEINAEEKKTEDFQMNMLIMFEDILKQLAMIQELQATSGEHKTNVQEGIRELANELKGLSVDHKKILETLQQFMMMQKLAEGGNLRNMKEDEVTWRERNLREIKLSSEDLKITEDELGHGGFGTVYIGHLHRSNPVAVKCIVDKRQRGTQQSSFPEVENEILLMKCLGNHPTLLSCYGYTRTINSIQVVLELAPFGSLTDVIYDFDTIPVLPSVLAVAWLCDMADALTYIHSKGVKHRDIKADNFLVFQWFRIKLCDFGLAKKHHSYASAGSMAGTLAFMAPEVKNSKGSTYASDIYSFAMTAVQVLTRQSPDPRRSSENQVQALASSIDLVDSKRLIDLLLECVNEDPIKRPKAPEVHRRCVDILETNASDPRAFHSKKFQIVSDLDRRLTEKMHQLLINPG
jgi:hypothetical protein